MPTLLRSGPYRFFIYSSDRDEPCHVHVARDEKLAKFWLLPIRLQHCSGFSRSELRQIQAIIVARHQVLAEAWNEYFGD